MEQLQEHFEALSCDQCGSLFGHGDGDLNGCKFMCPACLAKLPHATLGNLLATDPLWIIGDTSTEGKLPSK